MSNSTINGNHPDLDEELTLAARDLAVTLDRVPTVNELRRELKVGYEKAKPIHDLLDERARRWDETAVAATSPSGPDVLDDWPAEDLPEPQVTGAAELVGPPVRKVSIWPLVPLALPAFVAIWSGWVGLGGLTGFGVVHPFPGIWDSFHLNTAITLPIGMETYAAYALRIWLTPGLPTRARQFAMWSSMGALILGAGGQVTYHLLVSTGPWLITTLVSCLPVAVLGMGAALAHLVRRTEGAS